MTMYIYKVSLLIEGEENPALEAHLEDILKEHGEFLSSEPIAITGDNYGKCAHCGAWVSDPRKPGYIREFSPGAQIQSKWLCDLCLPENHPNAF